MKRSQLTNRSTRRGKTESGQSRYKEKQMRGEQMYGPGCCAHKLTAAQIDAAKRRAAHP